MPVDAMKSGMRSLAWIIDGPYCSLYTWKPPKIKFELSRHVKPHSGSAYTMKMDNLRKRLDKNRPMTTVSIRFPEDVIDDLKRMAPVLGFSGYQPLIRA